MRVVVAGLLAVLALSSHEARADLFAPPDAVSMTGDLQAVPLALGDYSGGGGADVLLGTLSGAALGILPGDGHGGFGSPEELDRGGTGWVPVDFDADDLADLATVADLSPQRAGSESRQPRRPIARGRREQRRPALVHGGSRRRVS